MKLSKESVSVNCYSLLVTTIVSKQQFLRRTGTLSCFCGHVTLDLMLLDVVHHYRKTQTVLSPWKSSPISKVALWHVRWVKQQLNHSHILPTSCFNTYIYFYDHNLLISLYPLICKYALKFDHLFLCLSILYPWLN